MFILSLIPKIIFTGLLGLLLFQVTPIRLFILGHFFKIRNIQKFENWPSSYFTAEISTRKSNGKWAKVKASRIAFNSYYWSFEEGEKEGLYRYSMFLPSFVESHAIKKFGKEKREKAFYPLFKEDPK